MRIGMLYVRTRFALLFFFFRIYSVSKKKTWKRFGIWVHVFLFTRQKCPVEINFGHIMLTHWLSVEWIHPNLIKQVTEFIIESQSIPKQGKLYKQDNWKAISRNQPLSWYPRLGFWYFLKHGATVFAFKSVSDPRLRLLFSGPVVFTLHWVTYLKTYSTGEFFAVYTERVWMCVIVRHSLK